MRRSTKIIIAGLCIFVVALTLFLIFDMQRQLSKRNLNNPIEENTATNSNSTSNVQANTTNTAKNENNTVNETVTKNEVTQNVVEQNTVKNNDVIQETEMNQVVETEKNNETAIDLVKKKWGADDESVYYTNEGINDTGEYLVAVRSKESTFAIANFKVNMSTKEVEIDL